MLKIITICTFLLTASTASAAILSWEAFTTTEINGIPTTEDGLTYQNNVEIIDTFTAGGTTYTNIIGYQLTSATFLENPTLSSIYYERTNQPNEFKSRRLISLFDAFNNSLEVGAGSDTTFQLVSSLVFTNPQGTRINSQTGLTQAGLSVVERGGNDTDFTVRAVTAVDSSGIATAFSAPVLIDSADPFGPDITDQTRTYAVYDAPTNDGNGPYNIFDVDVEQNVGGIFITFDTFGIDVGTIVYGYEISASTDSGLDLLAGAATFAPDLVNDGELSLVPEPAQFAFSVGILCLMVPIISRTRSRR
jgi:hypothetical protein